MLQSLEQKTDVMIMDSSPLKLLAVILLLCSLYLLIRNIPADNDEKSTPLLKTPISITSSQERLVRVFTLPVKKEKKTAPHEKNISQNKTISKGHTPAIDASFSLPIHEYLKILNQRAKAQLILFDSQQGVIKGEIIGEKLMSEKVDLKDKSLRARNISDDLSTSFRTKIIIQAGSLSKPYKFLIILPEKSERHFEQVLSVQLATLGISWLDINSLKLRYEKSGNHIDARILSANIKGKDIRINKTLRVW